MITGLTGTSGYAFYKVLSENNFSEKIRVVVRNTTDLSLFENTRLNLEILKGDIKDKVFLKTAVKDCRLVMHIAAKDFAKPISEAIAESPNHPNAIMISSTIVYSNYYRTSYLKTDEQYIKQIFKENGVKYVFIRPTMIFGTPTDRNISVFMKWFSKYKIFPIVKYGKANIQPVYFEDVAKAYFLVLNSFDKLKDDDYIVSGKDEMSLIEMFNIICKLINKKVHFINVPFNLAKFLTNTVYYASLKKIDYREKLDRLTENRAYSHKKISDELGYSPNSFEENLKKTIAHIKK